jgi:hypothetical protein
MLLAAQKKTARKGHTALPWMRVPAAFPPSQPVKMRKVSGIDPRLADALRVTGHSTLFPVQAVAWEVLAGVCACSQDCNQFSLPLSHCLHLASDTMKRAHRPSIEAPLSEENSAFFQTTTPECPIAVARELALAAASMSHMQTHTFGSV